MLAFINQWNDGGGISNVADGTQPAMAWGTSVTPVQNAYGSYAQLLAATSFETYWCEININSVFQTGVARECVVTIGVDEAGGSSYVDTINHLIGTGAKSWADSGGWLTAGGVSYAFPLRIKAGSSVAAKASVSTADVSAIRVYIRLRGKPSRPDLIWAGKVVETFGSVSASTFGTAITPGTASEGSWTQIGGGSPTKKWRYLDFGFGINNNTIAAETMIHIDVGVGDASNKQVAIANSRVYASTEESFRKDTSGALLEDAISQLVYMRAQGTSAPTGCKAAVYGVA